MNRNVLENILEANETKIWEGKPDMKSTGFFIARKCSPFLFIALPFLFASILGGECTINGKPGSVEECNNISFIMSGILLMVFIFNSIYSYLNYKVTRYFVTDKRIIFKSGVIGADINSVYYEQIKSLHVDVGLIGKIFGTGDVFIDTGKIGTGSKGRTYIIYDKIIAINKPYEVYNLIQKQQSITKNSMHSGRADYKFNTNDYKEFIQETEKMKIEAHQ